MDFFSMILEYFYEVLIEKFNFINNSVIRCVVQVFVMALVSAIIISIGFFIIHLIKKLKS